MEYADGEGRLRNVTECAASDGWGEVPDRHGRVRSPERGRFPRPVMEGEAVGEGMGETADHK
ncbi:hypothetical protein BDW27_103131 [Nocardiopsis sp. L17-MgMaSL7]|nr:hypothetical protein BDW27_103131 [Nocardiopsis sp. L17-MgMaSL7]